MLEPKDVGTMAGVVIALILVAVVCACIFVGGLKLVGFLLAL